ncbi:hypothetical protein MMPV_009195 [Pyropia vietnamensis]
MGSPPAPIPSAAASFAGGAYASLAAAAATSPAARGRLAAALSARSAAANIPLPGPDADVRAALRERGHPVCLFGEDPYDRRERLRGVLVAERERDKGGRRPSEGGGGKGKTKSEGISGGGGDSGDGNGGDDTDQSGSEWETDTDTTGDGGDGGGGAATPAAPPPPAEYYTPGPSALHTLRLSLLLPTLRRAEARTAAAAAASRTAAVAAEEAALVVTRGLTLRATVHASSRPLSAIALLLPPPSAGDGGRGAVGSWGGDVCLWRLPAATRPIAGAPPDYLHAGRVTGLSAGTTADGGGVVATAAADGGVALHRLDDSAGRCRFASSTPLPPAAEPPTAGALDVALHPAGAVVAATAGPAGVTLYDLPRGLRVATLPGCHVPLGAGGGGGGGGGSGVRKVAWHPDGSLAATVGDDGAVRLTDARSGRVVLSFPAAHAGTSTAIAWSPSGVALASGGSDNAVRVWDVRSRGAVVALPAHDGVVSSLRWGGGAAGEVLWSASVDRSVKAWGAARGWALLRGLTTHGDRVLDMDTSGGWLVSACYDKTWAAWAAEEGVGGGGVADVTREALEANGGP